MKISELMEQLEAILAAEGDIEARVSTDDGWSDPIVGIDGIDGDDGKRWVIL